MLCLSKRSFRIHTLRNPLYLATSIRAFHRSSTIMSQLTTSTAPSPSALNKPQHPTSSTSTSTTTLETLTFDNRAIATLPIDKEKRNFIREAVPDACFSLVEPTPVQNPVLVAASLPALSLIDIDEKQVERDEFVQYFSGNRLLPGSRPAAHCYCGHQFGYFSGQLGDGAAMYLGEVINSKGERWEIQLKGAGPTPYSRAADGRKVLRSSIREFLASEHMWALGVPTTRAGCVITSDSRVARDIFYTGNPIQERCSIVLRIAQTFLRFGSFEIFKPTDAETGRAGPSVGRTDILTTMLDYTIENFYPSIWSQYMDDPEQRYLAFYREITLRTARLVAGWQCVGFMHGVLNTDNMSIVGVTIDYGPYGWMEHFDADTICNTSDDGGRYTYRKQPEICRWNMEKLGEAIKDALPLEKSRKILKEYDEEYQRVYQTTMRHKLGLIFSPHDDSDLITSLFDTFQSTGADFTNTFRALNRIRCAADIEDNKDNASPSAIELNHDVIEYILSTCTTVEHLQKKLKPKIAPQQLQRIIQLMQHDPMMLHRMGINPMMIMSEMEKYEKLSELKELTSDKKRESDRKSWETWMNTYVERLQADTVIGQQQHQQQHPQHTIQQVKEHVRMQRIDRQNAHNPKYVLRNWMAQVAIDRAETGDYSEVRKLLELLLHPYTDQNESHVTNLDTKTVEKFKGKKMMCTYDTTPEWGGEICVSCSS